MTVLQSCSYSKETWREPEDLYVLGLGADRGAITQTGRFCIQDSSFSTAHTEYDIAARLDLAPTYCTIFLIYLCRGHGQTTSQTMHDLPKIALMLHTSSVSKLPGYVYKSKYDKRGGAGR